MASNPFLQSELVQHRGLEMTDCEVAERGRRAVVYYECDEGAEEYVARYFAKARAWLGHRLGEQMGLKCASLRSVVLHVAVDGWRCCGSMQASTTMCTLMTLLLMPRIARPPCP